jgi:hypothetical protein
MQVAMEWRMRYKNRDEFGMHNEKTENGIVLWLSYKNKNESLLVA